MESLFHYSPTLANLKHLLVKVPKRVSLLAHFGIHSFTHSFTRHVIPSTTDLLKAPLPQACPSASLQSIPGPVGSALSRSQGTLPPPHLVSKQALREIYAVSAQEQMLNWIRAPPTWEAWTIFLKRSSESC